MIGGALINATALVGGSSLAKYLSGDQNSAEEEKKRHDLTVERCARLPVNSIRKIEQRFSIVLQLMTE